MSVSRLSHYTLTIVVTLLAACAARETPVETRIANALPAVTVMAKGETDAVATADADAADDPAIWRNPADPAASLIVGTDKKAGLHVYDMTGRDLHFVDAGQVNNVDLVADGTGVLVVASDRNDRANAKLALFRLDTASTTLAPLATLPAGPGEAYGVCLGRFDGALYAFLVVKDGTIRQIALETGEGAAPTGRIVRTMKLATQSEGCVVDPRTRRLYVAEEDVGLWRFDAAADGSTAPTRIAAADGKAIVADAEGLAIAPEGANDGYLIVSSQGDNAYAVYRLSDDAYVGRFRIAAGRFGATEETDGIELAVGDFGPEYPAGLFVAQDGHNPPRAQNFKLVSWADIKTALKLP